MTNGIEKPVGLDFKTIKVNFNDLNTSIGLNFVEPDRILITPQFLDFERLSRLCACSGMPLHARCDEAI